MAVFALWLTRPNIRSSVEKYSVHFPGFSYPELRYGYADRNTFDWSLKIDYAAVPGGDVTLLILLAMI